MRARALCVAALLALASTHAAAAAAAEHAGEPQNLVTVISQALDYDAGLAEALAGVQAAGYAAPAARGALLPAVDAGWARGYTGIAVNGEPRIGYWQSGWMVQLSQPLFDWSRWLGYRQAGLAAPRAQAELERRRSALMLRAARACLDELFAEDDLARSTAYVAALREQQARVRALHAGGDATRIDLLDVDAQLASATAGEADARERRAAHRRTLEALTGRAFAPLSPVFAADAPVVLPALHPADPAPWIAQAETKHYAVQVAQLDDAQADYDVGKARAQRYPVAMLGAAHQPSGGSGSYAQPTKTTTAMLSVTIPLFSGGTTTARIGEARAKREQAAHALRAAVREAGAGARDAYERYRAGVEQVGNLQRVAAAQRASLDATRIGYTAGSRTSVDVLRALDALHASRRDLARAAYDAVAAFLELKASTATLSLKDVAELLARLHAAAQEAR